jgi:hypothetical protein
MELWHSEVRLRIAHSILPDCEHPKSGSLEASVKACVTRVALAPCMAVLFGVFGLQMPAVAHLGGDTASISADRDALHAQLHSTPMSLFEQHEITTDGGTVVHEYATPQGTVFAVTWQGPLPPDLALLFGPYYQAFQSAAAAQARPGMHRQLSVAGPDLVVQASGRLRAFRGIAYVPSLLPAGVSAANLQ